MDILKELFSLSDEKYKDFKCLIEKKGKDRND